ncbi:phosphatidylinositol/phosphatidylcholine transfer protein SFH11-like isoform X2 [Salvia splendens]|uniref:phosphatidylinositol/phosphatidylcholine transfer protein SFH11-like isoform X2 n=1 Tax=Salvia splendens TaxID=180675 RepID=UPI001C2539C3|nr:phosphatidylinositol/phosphatidylcholine transfer protein SFH11-like isoform X2 [Salvia splendens]
MNFLFASAYLAINQNINSSIMLKPKELLKEVLISGSPNPSSKCTERGPKAFHPPIETHWQLPPVKEKRPRGIMKLLSQPFKYRWRSQSQKWLLEGTHNPKDDKIVDAFRELLFLEGHLSEKHLDYHTLLRFLRMRDYDLMKAKDMFVQYVKWREEMRIDTILQEFSFEECEEVKKCYPHGYHGVDRCGRPVYIESIGMADLDMFLRVTTIERFVKHHICEQEKTLSWRYPACSLAAKKHIASTISILDVKDVGMNHFSKPARYLFMEIQKIDSCYYPETLHLLFIVNAGPGFRVLWKVIKAFLDARTLAKIIVLGSDYKRSLIEAIDPSNLPSFLGGDCTCCDTGGCLFSDKGPWNDPEITATLEAMLYTEEGEQRNCSSEKSAFGHNQNSEFEDSSPTNEIARDSRKYVDGHFFQKLQAFEPVIEDAKEKIKMLETALEDAKLVLKGLSQHMEELKR